MTPHFWQLCSSRLMNFVIPELKAATDVLLFHIRRLTAERNTPTLVALDGGSGSGKSTLARSVAATLDVSLVHGDDFYAANIPDVEWDAKTPSERARDVIDWRRLRTQALEPLLAGKSAEWQTFDFKAGTRPDGTYEMKPGFTEQEAQPVIVLDGAYAARPELSDIINLSVLVDVPLEVRHQRLAAREARDFLAQWHARWDAAEAWYFTHVRPASSFDLVVTTSPSPAGTLGK